MKKNIHFYAFLIFSTIVTFFIFSGCKNQNQNIADSDFIELTPLQNSAQTQVQSQNLNEALFSKPKNFNFTNKRILVLFGYDFNTDEITKKLTDLLAENFGLDSDGGLIYTLTYPSDFKHNYTNELSNVLQNNDREISGVVILGAPERTHTALAKNQDKWNRNVPYPVIALFPQDEGLGLESTCDIVLDKGQAEHAESFGENGTEEIENAAISEAPEILLNTIKYIQNIDGGLPRDSKIQQHAKQMFKNHKISHYIDTETNLPSINHFVLN